MKRYEKKLVLEFEAPDAITFEVSNEKKNRESVACAFASDRQQIDRM